MGVRIRDSPRFFFNGGQSGRDQARVTVAGWFSIAATVTSVPRWLVFRSRLVVPELLDLFELGASDSLAELGAAAVAAGLAGWRDTTPASEGPRNLHFGWPKPSDARLRSGCGTFHTSGGSYVVSSPLCGLPSRIGWAAARERLTCVSCHHTWSAVHGAAEWGGRGARARRSGRHRNRNPDHQPRNRTGVLDDRDHGCR